MRATLKTPPKRKNPCDKESLIKNDTNKDSNNVSLPPSVTKPLITTVSKKRRMTTAKEFKKKTIKKKLRVNECSRDHTKKVIR